MQETLMKFKSYHSQEKRKSVVQVSLKYPVIIYRDDGKLKNSTMSLPDALTGVSNLLEMQRAPLSQPSA